MLTAPGRAARGVFADFGVGGSLGEAVAAMPCSPRGAREAVREGRTMARSKFGEEQVVAPGEVGEEQTEASGEATPRKGRKRGGSAAAEDTVVIEVEDDSPSPAKQARVGRGLRSASRLQDTDKLCEFPLGASSKVIVTLQDYRTLEYDTFLNDIIIDFYLTYLFETKLAKEFQSSIYIFSTMFYKRLIDPRTKAKANTFEKDKTLNSVQKRHLRVKGWTKAVDLLEKDMIIIPICEHSHWYLVIVIKPRLVTRDQEDRRVGAS